MVMRFQDPDLLTSVAAAHERPRARNSDPGTSKRAAVRARTFAWSHSDRILGMLWRPMIAAEIAKCTALTVVQVDRRMPELQAAGLVRLTGRERDGMREWAKVLQV